jgi:tetratricopeptide (TPR) repeat protein
MKRVAMTWAILVGLWLAAGSSFPLAEARPPAPSPLSPPAGKEVWTSVRSRHLLFVTNAGERAARPLAVKLEQFRAAFARLFPQAGPNPPVPTTIILFKDESAYRPFIPLYQGKSLRLTGYFQPGEDVNYITLSLGVNEKALSGALFHEYVHSLAHGLAPQAPLWLKEGLAEFYSAIELLDGKSIALGKVIDSRSPLLREKPIWPLSALFAVTYDSPHYRESDQRSLFYAQSWALVHYLWLGHGGRRRPQFARYLELLAAGRPAEESFRQAFQTDDATLEQELRNYLARGNYPTQVVSFDRRLEFDAELRSAPVTEAEAQFYLGDLLFHVGQVGEAESYLRRALALDEQLAPAHASLGLLRLREQRFAEARRHFERAVEANSQSYLVHYYYAYALGRESTSEDPPGMRFSSETARRMRAALQRAIELAPDFPAAYRLLASLNLAMDEQLEGSVALLKRGLARMPGQEDLTLMLAQMYLRWQDYEAALKLCEPIARSGATPGRRAEAQSLLEIITRVTERPARLQSKPD